MNSAELKQKLLGSFPIPEAKDLHLGQRFFYCGSCFSENISGRLKELDVEVLANPFGILYDPLSIARCADRLAGGMDYTESDLFFASGNYHALDHHGSFKGPDKGPLLDRLNQSLHEGREFLKTAHIAVITPGTAFAWYHHDTLSYVANCHKIPNKNFSKNLLTEKNILETLQQTVGKLRSLNPGLSLIFTLSPVKHLRDGPAENALSKARLLSALSQFTDSSDDPGISYFPAYEIMTEELRDYRFYDTDLAHPSEWSTAYIFQRFIESRFDPRANEYFIKAANFIKMLEHRMMSGDERDAAAWDLKKEETRRHLQTEFPEMPFTFLRD